MTRASLAPLLAPEPTGDRPDAHGTRPQSVALVTSARSWRGSSTVFATIGRALRARGHAVRALVAREEVGCGFRARGLDAVALPTAHTRLKGALALRRTLRELHADIAFVDMPRDIRLTALASLGSPLTVICCLSTADPPADALTRIAFRRVRLTVFLTEHLARRALAAAPFMRRVPYRVIPNGVDCAVFRPDVVAGSAFRKLYGLGDGALLVGAGALAREKRWDLLLESLALLPRPAPPLLLCGSGGLEGTLRAQAERLGLDVRFLGWLGSAPLIGAFNAATCVVHAGHDETFGLAVAEAMACGRPVLAVGSGTVPELVGETAVTVPPENPTVFARLLGALLADAPRREALGVAARRRVLERFSLERMARAYVHLVERGARPRASIDLPPLRPCQ